MGTLGADVERAPTWGTTTTGPDCVPRLTEKERNIYLILSLFITEAKSAP